jgi:hypothetical protein
MRQRARLAIPRLIAAKPLLAFLAVALLVAAACSESALPTESKLGLQPHFTTLVLRGGCPNPFTATGMSDGNPDALAADLNGDGVACYLIENEIIVSWIDNNVPLSQIGACPNAFSLVPAKDMGMVDSRDNNGDGWVCIMTNGNGSTIVIDNNHRTSGMM